MVMRLLQKSDINKAKAVAQKMDIDEGAKLERRIDNLRSVLAEEEQSLKRFRTTAIAKIHEETKAAAQERDTILDEVRELRKERKELMQPLEKEWAELYKEQKRVAKESEETNSRTITAQEAERQAKKAVRQASNILAKAAQRDDLTREKLSEAVAAEREAKVVLANAKKIEAKAKQLSDDMTKELIHRDMDSASRERSITMKEANLKTGEAELAKGWALLEDRKQAFERQIKRLKK